MRVHTHAAHGPVDMFSQLNITRYLSGKNIDTTQLKQDILDNIKLNIFGHGAMPLPYRYPAIKFFADLAEAIAAHTVNAVQAYHAEMKGKSDAL